MVSSHDFSFKNGSEISVTNDDRLLQWLLDFDWLLTSCLFSLIYLARKMRRNARESDNLFISSMYAPEVCNTSYKYQWKFISVSLLLQFIATAIEKPGHWMKQQFHSRLTVRNRVIIYVLRLKNINLHWPVLIYILYWPQCILERRAQGKLSELERTTPQ